MKNNKLKDRRVINIPKLDYDVIKDYCDKNTLDLPKWMVKNSKEKMEMLNTEDLSEYQSDDIWSSLDDESDKFKTYENINPEFRFTVEFVCNVLFGGCDKTDWKLVKDNKDKCFYLKQKIFNVTHISDTFLYQGIKDFTFTSIKNAYKDLCDDIEWGIQDGIEDESVWFIYRLETKDKSYYEE
jgi:hypothetical protein